MEKLKIPSPKPPSGFRLKSKEQERRPVSSAKKKLERETSSPESP